MSAGIARVGVIVGLDEHDDVDRLAVSARLFADTDAGTRLTAPRATMGATMWRRGISAIWKRYSGPPLPEEPSEQMRALESYRVQRRDVEDAINQLLGRDPEQHRPPRLSWEPLIALLNREDIHMTEEHLIATPFEFEFSDELIAELGGR